MKTFYKIEDGPGRVKRAIFRVSTNQGECFLCIDGPTEDFSVVEVNPALFVELWRNDRYEAHLHVSQGNPDTWRQDSKFADAQSGFSHGEVNPVPLALVSCAIRNETIPVYERRYLFFKKYKGEQIVKRVPYVSFTNGITRTIWLLSHQVERFPVMCETKQAELLQLMVGFPDGRPQTVKALLERG